MVRVTARQLPINFQQLEIIEETLPRLLSEKTQLEAASGFCTSSDAVTILRVYIQMQVMSDEHKQVKAMTICHISRHHHHHHHCQSLPLAYR